MNNAALQACRTHTTEDGVTIHMLPFSTPLYTQVLEKMREAFGTQTEKPGGPVHIMPLSESIYSLCVSVTLQIDLPTVGPAPHWASILHEFMKDKSYFMNPVERWYDLAAVAPEELFTKWFQAREATRPVELLAPAAVRRPAPPAEIEDEEEHIVPNPNGETTGS